MLARSDRRIAATKDQWDSNPLWLNSEGTFVDLQTGVGRVSRPEDYCTRKTGAAAAHGEPVLFLDFLNRIMGNNKEMIAYLQRVFGYCLTGLTTEHVMFFFYGTGANGKSVLLSTIAGILGDYHKTAAIETFTIQAGTNHPTDLAWLRGARLVTAIETEEGRRWAESKIKALTGGDEISARFMRQDFFTFKPQFKLIVAGNHKPSLRTVDEAMTAGKTGLKGQLFEIKSEVEDELRNALAGLKPEEAAVLAMLRSPLAKEFARTPGGKKHRLHRRDGSCRLVLTPYY